MQRQSSKILNCCCLASCFCIIYSEFNVNQLTYFWTTGNAILPIFVYYSATAIDFYRVFSK